MSSQDPVVVMKFEFCANSAMLLRKLDHVFLWILSNNTGVTGAPVAFKTWCGNQYRVGIICPPLVEIGLRWLPKLGVDTSPRPHAHRRACIRPGRSRLLEFGKKIVLVV